uniref:Uncharacterized protein n=1 Tax=Ciona intestinalis TaxID=7719 RepID=H2XXA4_CIOIN
MSNSIERSPLIFGSLDSGIPSAGIFFVYFGCTMSLIGMFSNLPSSVGTLLGPWSPSCGNVTFVPAFQPGFTWMVRILSRILEVCPSSFITLREIFIFLVHPWNSSSKERKRSLSIGGSCFFLPLPLIPPNPVIKSPFVSKKSANGFEPPKKSRKTFSGSP